MKLTKNQEQLPEVISSATTLESSILLLSKRVLELQKTHNQASSEENNLVIITIETDETEDPLATISLSNIEADFIAGKLNVERLLVEAPDSFVTKEFYPWNSKSSLECLCNLLLFTLRHEKQTSFNTNEFNPMTLTLTQNTNLNERMFTFAASLILPLNVGITEENIVYTADEYLSGDIDFETL
ncbi:MAG: hypothetical protein F6K54_16200 [Okeania sp. SIO3B5]|uniref:hypothetical protein n=1 Tax=Okeania sp. SIO3B5 TaxID=2607811 RepID=UPI0013FFCD68|nr:hypothetical protein [Okeania sp. SIO3B5]NEO54486.1 hypothetical protein [Okeania sp. SIO3B5]